MGRQIKSQTERDKKPKVLDMVSTLYNELMTSITDERVEEVRKVGSRSRQIGLLTTLMCDSVEKSCIYYTNGSGHIFDGRMYKPFRTEDLAVAVRKILETPRFEFDESMRRNGTIQDICANLKNLIHTRRLNLDRDLVAFSNGVLNLETMEFNRHSKKVAPFCYIDVEYDPAAECYKWNNFLEEVLPVEDVRKILQEFLGCAFIDRRKMKVEAMMILYGAGSNGKSVIAHTIANVLGENNITHFSFDDLLSSSDVSKNTDKLNNKLVNFSEEVSAVHSSRYGDRLKALISGDSLMCRPIYGETYTTESLPMLMANANKLPKMDDSSHGLMRRMIIVEFTRIIPTALQDHLLESKLEQEKSGIINWILEGRARMVSNNGNFTNGDSIALAAESFMAANNSVLEFMFDKNYYPFPETPEQAILPYQHRLTNLYSEYDQWCVSHRYRAISPNEFRVALESAGYAKHRKAVGIVFDVFSRTAFEDAKKRLEDEQKASKLTSQRQTRPLTLHDGRMICRGDYNAASLAHLSRSWVVSMRLAGKLNDALIPAKELGMRENPSLYFYDIQRLVEIAKQLRAYVSEEKLEEFDKEVFTNTNMMQIFNREMREKRMPFRKIGLGLTNQQMFMIPNSSTKDYIIVDNDWEYSDEAAEALIEEVEREQMNKFK